MTGPYDPAMAEGTAIEGKVTALITRFVDGQAELCVFDHAGWVQIPAGTLEDGEHPIAGVVREAWEETGIPRLEVVAKVAVVDDDVPGRERHVFHLRATEPTPEVWWVLTPDGGGHQWRCRWIPLDGGPDHDAMHDVQRAWLDPVRDLLDVALPVDRLDPALLPGAAEVEVFHATAAVRYLSAPREDGPPTHPRVAWVTAIGVTADGDAVIVTEDATRGWGLPGIRPDHEETPEAAVARILRAHGAGVVDTEHLMTTDDVFLDDSRRPVRQQSTAAYWARVELDDAWAPRDQGAERRLVPIADLADELRWELPINVRLHDLAWRHDLRARSSETS
jgi:8-oxo-dGTP pyrophosphatase MutT (NUDIX family)